MAPASMPRTQESRDDWLSAIFEAGTKARHGRRWNHITHVMLTRSGGENAITIGESKEFGQLAQTRRESWLQREPDDKASHLAVDAHRRSRTHSHNAPRARTTARRVTAVRREGDEAFEFRCTDRSIGAVANRSAACDRIP